MTHDTHHATGWPLARVWLTVLAVGAAFWTGLAWIYTRILELIA